jgi:hypothetical protein
MTDRLKVDGFNFWGDRREYDMWLTLISPPKEPFVVAFHLSLF